MVRIGVIGCGKIAQVRHIPEYEANPDARVVALFDANAERARELAAAHGCRACATLEELLAADDVDAVSVCTSNATHAQTAIAALRAGKDVLCEKPMAVTIEECEAMVAAARETGRTLMIDQNQRLARAHVRAKELLDAGRIGRVLTFRTTFGHGGPETWSVDPGTGSWFFDPKRAAMGAMADLGVHKTDLVQWLIGQTVVSATAKVTTLDKCDPEGNLVGVDDNALVIYEMSGGAVGTMTASWTYYGPEDNSTVLYGTEGVMRVYDDPAHSIVIDRRDGERELYDVEAIQTNDNQTASGVIDAFVGGLVRGEGPLISGESVLPAMRAVFASIESSRTGRTVPVKTDKE
ncbi:Gfo/Idh/MocA family protein [Thermophilibacter sp.]